MIYSYILQKISISDVRIVSEEHFLSFIFLECVQPEDRKFVHKAARRNVRVEFV